VFRGCVMDTDLVFVGGIFLIGFAFPSFLSAFAESRRPRAAILMIVLGGALTWLAVYQRPSIYSVQTIPDAFVRVVGTYIY
jgi:hypothetical protein